MSNTYKKIYRFGGDYTSIYINNELIVKGSRDPFNRINKIPLDFSSKTVLDLGCNCGGMLFSLSDKIKYGYGLEVNEEAVNNANTIINDFNVKNIEINLKNLEELDNFSFPKTDIVFMLSISRWVSTWKKIIEIINPKVLVFEAHGKPAQVEEQLIFINSYFKSVEHLLTARENKIRHLYICKN